MAAAMASFEMYIIIDSAAIQMPSAHYRAQSDAKKAKLLQRNSVPFDSSYPKKKQALIVMLLVEGTVYLSSNLADLPVNRFFAR